MVEGAILASFWITSFPAYKRYATVVHGDAGAAVVTIATVVHGLGFSVVVGGGVVVVGQGVVVVGQGVVVVGEGVVVVGHGVVVVGHGVVVVGPGVVVSHGPSTAYLAINRAAPGTVVAQGVVVSTDFATPAKDRPKKAKM